MDLTKNVTYKCDKCGKVLTSPGISVSIRGPRTNIRGATKLTYFKHVCERCDRDLTDLLEHHKRKFFDL